MLENEIFIRPNFNIGTSRHQYIFKKFNKIFTSFQHKDVMSQIKRRTEDGRQCQPVAHLPLKVTACRNLLVYTNGNLHLTMGAEQAGTGVDGEIPQLPCPLVGNYGIFDTIF